MKAEDPSVRIVALSATVCLDILDWLMSRSQILMISQDGSVPSSRR